jgi:hypothetical protein
MTFTMYRRDAGPLVVLRRPIAKCAGCGQRIFADIVARQRVHKSTQPG